MTPVHDVVVIGAGAAGLSAALEAARARLDVVLLEAFPSAGGAAALSGGGCCLVGTPLQHQRGIDDSVELALTDWLRAGGGQADEGWARRYLADSTTMVGDWLASLGVSWVDLRLQEGNTVARWHQPRGAGRSIIDALLAALAAVNVVPSCGTRVTGLQLREDADAPMAISVTCDDSAVSHLHARAVVLATGGFVNNRALLEEQDPGLRTVLRGGAPQALGGGHRLLAELGGQLSGMANIWTYPIGTPDPRETTGDRGLAVRGLASEVWVNRNGDRFCDETLRGGATGTRALMAQPGQTSWGLMDVRGSAGLYVLGDGYYQPRDTALARARLDELLAGSPHITRAASIPELATAAGLPVDAVCNSVEQFNAAVRGGIPRDPKTGRELRGALPLDSPPFTAIRYFPLAQKNLGGVVTDGSCRVRLAGGRVQQGVYAAGELAGMAGGHINGAGALEGTMLGPSLYSGRLAGRGVAHDLTAAGSRQHHHHPPKEWSAHHE